MPVGAIGALGGWASSARACQNPNEVMNFAARFESIFEFESGSGKTRTRDLAGGDRRDQGAADLRLRRRHVPARLPQVQAGRVRRATRATSRSPTTSTTTRCSSRRASASSACCCSTAIMAWAAIRSCATGVQAFRRSPAHPVRRVLGGVRRLPRPAHVRPVGDRQHVPAVGGHGRRARADRLGRRGQGAVVGHLRRPHRHGAGGSGHRLSDRLPAGRPLRTSSR